MEHLNTLFSTAKVDAESFTALLDQEHKALVDRDMPALELLLAEKAPLVTSLAQHDRAIITANERNARLIRHSQQATGQLLDLLRNQGESSQNIYDSQGLSSRSGTPRNLTKV
jgi:flagella synthesis protein FlgN